MSISSKLACVCAASMLLHASGGLAAAQQADDAGALPLAEYSLERLSDIVVTPVAHAGATTLPEALRLAPTLQVAPVSTQQYPISTRGFSSRLTNKLLRRVARLPQAAVPGYHELDARMAWQARPDVELALAGHHLLQAGHPAFGAAGQRQLAERGAFATVSLRF